MRGGMSVPWGMGVPGGWEFQGGVGVPGGWEFQGDECSGGWVSRGKGVPDTLCPMSLHCPVIHYQNINVSDFFASPLICGI